MKERNDFGTLDEALAFMEKHRSRKCDMHRTEDGRYMVTIDIVKELSQKKKDSLPRRQGNKQR